MRTQVTVKPIADRVVVLPEEPESVSPGGILLPEAARKRTCRGRVVAVGSGTLLQDGTRAAMEVQEGDEVYYAQYGGNEITIDDETFVVLRESDILAVL